MNALHVSYSQVYVSVFFLNINTACFSLQCAAVHECIRKNKINLLLETLVVTAVTDAREMVSGSNDPARRIAFLSRSSMSRIAGSSGRLKQSKSTLGECRLIPSVSMISVYNFQPFELFT